ncbi:testis-expressed protein 36 [Numida meleagris]|uniref:testis-expressed protein 36 n=1 Tax=Numida meleagris TaxID=8996 RepID=UPI000B3E18C3|nr:testis-expressed protein 36 [Numida meleagris]
MRLKVCSVVADKHPPWQPAFCAGFGLELPGRAAGVWADCSTESTGALLAHAGGCWGQLESTTCSAQGQAQALQAAGSVEDRLPPVFQGREQRKVNNNFPFSSHDNTHFLQNVGEDFNFGMGRRKVEPQRGQQNHKNHFQWASESAPRSEDGITIYQTSFVKVKSTESPFCRHYPNHCSEKSRTDKPVPEIENNMQPNKSS